MIPLKRELQKTIRVRCPMIKKDRLPPGQKLVKDFPIFQCGDIPELNEKQWSFSVTGLVEKPLKLTYREFLALPSTELTTDFHCVTGWSKFDLRWKGILFKTIVSMTKPLKEAKFVEIIAEQDYSTNLPLIVATDDDVILAYGLDGKPLTKEHGFPLRLVVPKRYAYKCAKWVTGLNFLREDRPGFWEKRGYSNSADPWKEERFS
jgi:DMSO/TMAO reductase YedYZ molybdopterin-dependent catalytic subunit